MDGLDEAAVSKWLLEHVEGVTAPFDWALMSGGRSNLTFVGTDANGRRLVLRRPPLIRASANAHDVGREYRIIAALAGTDVPVPTALGSCESPDVIGEPFYVMDHVEGVILRDESLGDLLPGAEQRAAVSQALVETLALIHGVDIDAAGLGRLARREADVERQLRRWLGQFEASCAVSGRTVTEVRDAYERLAAHVPEQHGATIAHGDFRIDNCVLREDGSVAAVLDWELCTLGDPLTDVGQLLICWSDPAEPLTAKADAVTKLPGFWSWARVREAYAAATGRDLAEIAYYEAFQYWRMACISENVYSRYAGGAMGDDAEIDLDEAAQRTINRARAALSTLDAAGY